MPSIALAGSGVLWSIVTSEVPKCGIGGRSPVLPLFGSLFQVSDSAFNSEYDSVFDSAFDYVYDCGTFAGH